MKSSGTDQRLRRTDGIDLAILNKDAARQNAMYLVPGPIAENMKTYPKRNAPEEGV